MATTLSNQSPAPSSQEETRARAIKVFMMDLWSTVPYYDAYLCQALRSENVSVHLGAITYYLDPDCFSMRGIRNRPGLLDIVGRFKLPGGLRKLLKFLESGINAAALMLRFAFSRPDVIHVQYLPMLALHLPFDFWFLRYCRWRGCKLVCTVHDLLPSDTGEKHRQIFQKLYEMMDALICHSGAVKEELFHQFQFERERIHVIPHGPFFYDFPLVSPEEARRKLGIGADECLVLWQGIIRPYKGVEFLLEAWKLVQQAGVHAHLLVAGTGDPSLLASIQEKVNALGLNNAVDLRFEFAPSEEMLSYYQAADIVVYPYKTVTTSGALMTGVTQGKAIVATSLPPFRELLQDGQNALLCNYGDAPQLTAALLKLIQNPSLRNQLASEAAALNLGEQMWQQIAQQTAACYGAVL